MSDRDEPLDRLLRQAAHLRGATPAGACPDAEQLAAFVSGSLRAAERDAWEAHVAGCGRCLQLVATLARTEEPPATRAPWWRPANWTWWLVPATAVATAIALWVNVSPDRQPAERESTRAAVDRRATEQTAPTTIPPPPAAAEAPPQKAPDASKPALSAKAADTPAPETRARRQTSARRDERAGQLAPEEKALSPRAAAPAPVASPPPPAASARTVAERELRVQERSGAALDRIATLYRDAAGRTEVLSPDPAIRWRFSGPAIERTSDGGATWTTQFTAPAPILAGTSLSPLVAWMVGRNGTVLLTVDGQQWQRMPFPETVDLVAVRARSDREADVIAADGRTFRTSDGGKNWNPVNR